MAWRYPAAAASRGEEAMTYGIEKIEGIGTVYGDKLRAAGIKDTDALLARCTTPKDRAALAEATGIASALVLKFANRADLMRVKGVGEEYADLLEAAGVDTVPELARRKAANLHAALEQANAAKKLVRQAPGLKAVQGWIAAAQEMPRALQY
jgi:predicted flap endonuclease-1-like 5' DNA nuclease